MKPGPKPSHVRLLGGAILIMVLSHTSHAGDTHLALTWNPADRDDPATGQLTPQITATATAPGGETIQAVATCDDSLPNARTGSDEDIDISVFQGNTGADFLWDNNVLTVTYAVDNYPQQTTTVGEKFSNVVTVEVAYSDMSTARHFTMDLPLANGDDPILDLNPTDTVMRGFTEICEKQFRADYPPVAPAAPTAPVAPVSPAPKS